MCLLENIKITRGKPHQLMIIKGEIYFKRSQLSTETITQWCSQMIQDRRTDRETDFTTSKTERSSTRQDITASSMSRLPRGRILLQVI
jgi:hypothetical protein